MGIVCENMKPSDGTKNSNLIYNFGPCFHNAWSSNRVQATHCPLWHWVEVG